VSETEHASQPAPRHQVRRFDVFAEYNRQKNLEKGIPDKYAKGEALWVAKVVASRGGGVRGRLHRDESDHGKGDDAHRQGEAAGQPRWEFKTLSGEVQSDTLFDNEIVKRLGRDFYVQVFEPAIARAVAEGSRYEDIRDVLRHGWNAVFRRRAA
jgi:hypothetical protein